MAERAARWSDEQVEGVMAVLLRYGVLLAAAVVLAGACVYLIRHGTEAPRYGVFHGEPEDLRTIGGIIRDTWQGRGRGLIQLGLLLLIATPIARVVFGLVAFMRQRDRLYTAVALIVLGTLLYSLLGHRG